MALLSSYQGKRVLIIDDVPAMRNSIRRQVISLGIDQVNVAADDRRALELLQSSRFDILLCDYYLGGSTDGQQFLEYLRTRRIISRAALFVMITAEKRYASVITAAECLPDDYLLKPFTAEILRSRLDRLLERKLRLARIDQLHDQGRWSEIIPLCNEIIAARDKFLVDALRVKGNALILTGRFDQAIGFYRQALQKRSMPWAKLGLAKAYEGTGDREQAKRTLADLIAETPRFLAAYDVLGRLHRDAGEPEEALNVLDRACELSPNALARHRAIGACAEEVGDFARVEQAMSTVLHKTRDTPLRDLDDYARLGNAWIELGDAGKAIALITEARSSFKESSETPHIAALEAVAQHQAGNVELAQQALTRAMQGSTQTMPEAIKLAIAKACLVQGRNDEAERMLKDVLQNNPASTLLHSSISRIMQRHGDPARVESLIRSSNAEVIKINDDAVRKGQAGDFATASAMLREAAERLPGNLQIVANAAYALFLDVLRNGLDGGKLRDARRFQQMLLAGDRHHPKLREIGEIAAKVQQKFKLPAAS